MDIVINILYIVQCTEVTRKRVDVSRIVGSREISYGT